MPQSNLKYSLPSDSSDPTCKFNRCILFNSVILIAGIILGIILCKIYISSIPAKTVKTYDDGYKAAIDVAKNKLIQKGIFVSSSSNGTNVSRAIVRSIAGNNIKVEIESSMLDFFADGVTNKTIVISDKTKIIQLTPKSVEQFNQEQDDFGKNISRLSDNNETTQNDSSAIVPPSPFFTKNITVDDLKAGDLISFYGNSDLSKSDSMEAISISVTNIPAQQDQSADILKSDNGTSDVNNLIIQDDIKNQIPQPSDTDIKTNEENNIKLEGQINITPEANPSNNLTDKKNIINII